MDAWWGSKRALSRASKTMIALLSLGLGVGCRAADPPTEVVVAVTSDLRSGTELTELQVRVLDKDGKVELTHKKIQLGESKGSGIFTLPLSYSLTPTESARSAFRLVVTGRGPDGGGAMADRVEAQALASFRARQRMVLPISLNRSCLEQLCREDAEGSDLTCLDGECKEVPLIELEPAGSGDGIGGDKKDAGALTHPGDAGPSCENADDCQAALDAASPSGCATAQCKSGRCVFSAVDVDDDGHRTSACSLDGYAITVGDDCDDGDPNLYPGAWDGPRVPNLEGMDQERCDQRDNDCDGEVDEDSYEGSSCTCDANAVNVDCSLRSDGSTITWPAGTPVGRCKYGKRSCEDGVWGECMSAVEPLAKDTCDPEDDSDCDGQRNEGCPCVAGAERPCGSDVGSCMPGTQTCAAGGVWSAECAGAVGPKAADTCEPNNDDDCDGRVNEGCTCVNGTVSSCGQVANARGACASKTITCANGAWPTTQCNVGSAEQCNGDNVDEDCDGMVNEGCKCVNDAISSCALELGLKGACESQPAYCIEGAWVCFPGSQANDGCTRTSDENCNGIPHEGCNCVQDETRSCPGAAGCTGTQTCNGRGNWGNCRDITCPADAGVAPDGG